MFKFLTLAFAAFLFSAGTAKSQLTIAAGSTFLIQPNAVVTVEGDVIGNADIQGGGKLLLKGTGGQTVNMNGFNIPNLEIDNVANATLTGNIRIGSSLLFTNGKIKTGNFNLNLADVAISTGMGTGKFLETTGTGQIIKELTANVTSNEIPVGAGILYRPAFITTSGTYSSANVGIQVFAVADPNRPPSLTDYIAAYWPVTKTGITGTVTVAGQYDNADISGIKPNLRGYYYAASDWSSAGQTNTASTNQISAPITAASGELSGFDKFDLVNAKAFLQGAYPAGGGGLMNENLRTTGTPGTNLIPNADPYRTAPYNTIFTHVANTLNENAVAAVFADQGIAGNNIVDWIFLELRNNNASPGNIILQTRSALIQRDGDIVDVDGISPVTFNNTATGSYTLAVRHRNHLGLSTDPATFSNTFGETRSTTPLVDYTTATDAQLYGPASAFTVSSDAKNLLWGGNANYNANTKFTGLSNDKDELLINALGNNTTTILNNVYNSSDLNMNRNVKFTGLTNDKDLLLISALGNTTTIIRSELLPN